MPPKRKDTQLPGHLQTVAEILGGKAPKLVLCVSSSVAVSSDTVNALVTAAKPMGGPIAPVPSLVPVGGATESERKALAATEAMLNQRKAAAAALSIPLVQWDCSPVEGTDGAQLAAIRSSLGVTTLPCLLALDNGELCDKLVGQEDVEGPKSASFIAKFKEYCVARNETPPPKMGRGVVAMPKGDTASAANNMTVDVSKMITMGKDMLAKREPVYAEKFFTKALNVLDVAASEGGVRVAEVDDNLEGSIALTLSWLVIAQLLQSRPVVVDAPTPVTANNCPAGDRLERDFAKWITPASQCSLAVAMREMFRYFPCAFDTKATVNSLMETVKSFQEKVIERSMARAQQQTGMEGSPPSIQSNMSTVLTEEEQNVLLGTRCQLIIVFLISLDIERAVTEALKVNATGHEFGSIAIKAIRRTYLGNDM